MSSTTDLIHWVMTQSDWKKWIIGLFSFDSIVSRSPKSRSTPACGSVFLVDSLQRLCQVHSQYSCSSSKNVIYQSKDILKFYCWRILEKLKMLRGTSGQVCRKNFGSSYASEHYTCFEKQWSRWHTVSSALSLSPINNVFGWIAEHARS